jgi:hypothetical protein
LAEVAVAATELLTILAASCRLWLEQQTVAVAAVVLAGITRLSQRLVAQGLWWSSTPTQKR